jgi:uncharacterized protein (TIGR00255 family)
MPRSMTGYAKVTETWKNKKMTVEIKSLNAKSFTPIIKIPDRYNDKELEIKNILSLKLIGGKVNFTLTVTDDEAKTININEQLINAYIEKFKSIAEKNKLDTSKENILLAALKMPDVLLTEEETIDDEEWNAILKTINKTVSLHDNFRIQEGEALGKDILEKISNIENLLDTLAPFEEERITNVKNRLKIKLNEYINSNNQNDERFEQEIIYFLEKFDINEEKVRLKNHCKYFTESFNVNEPAGSKLGFIAQEIGREINTIGSKANHSEIQKIVVNMKDALEKVKEQLFNVL